MIVLLSVLVIPLFVLSNFFGDREDIEILATFMLLTQRFYKPFRTLMTMNISMQRATAVARRIFKLLDREAEVVAALPIRAALH